jgi:hypothetical protein
MADSRYYKLNPKGDMDIDIASIAKDSKLYIATCCYGDMLTAGYTISLVKTIQFLGRCGIKNKWSLQRNNSDVALARNLLVAGFLATDCTHILFIDADIQWDEKEPMRMLAMDLPVLGGLYARKFIFGDSVSKGIEPVAEIPKQAKTIYGAVEAIRLPGGFLLIKREVFQTIIKQRPDLKWDLGSDSTDKEVEAIKPFVYAFFEHGMNFKKHTFIGEDYAFCDLCRECGIEIWADQLATLGHVGGYTYIVDPRRIMENNK